MKSIIKSKNGITLVALVVTIIILLILAGITISQLTGSGLFENTRLAEQKSKEAQEKEEGILADYENKIGEYVEGSREDSEIIKQLQEKVNTLEEEISNTKKLSVQTGITDTIEIPTSSGVDYSVTFNNEMKDINYSISIDMYQGGNYWGYLTYYIYSIDTTGFKIRVHNTSDSHESTTKIRWSIVGEEL